MIRLDRSRRGTDIWLGEKMIFFVIGAALGIAGMVTGHDWLIWAAIVVLAIGFLLRVLGRRRSVTPDASPDGEWEREEREEREPGQGDPDSGEGPRTG